MFSLLTNVSATRINHSLGDAAQRLERHAARLATGLRVNSARDDAAGLAIVSRLIAFRRGADVGLRSINDLASLVQVADSALGIISDNLQRIRELAVQAANPGYQFGDRQALQGEANQLIVASRAIQAMTEFNGQRLLNGSLQLPASGVSGVALPALVIQPLFMTQTTDVIFRYAQYTQASVTVSPSAALQAGDLTINRLPIPASVVGAQPGQNAGSAWAVAKAINQSGEPDLIAVAEQASVTGNYVVLAGGTNVAAGDIVINGVPVAAGNVVTAINGIAGQTGVIASLSSGPTLPGPPPQAQVRLSLRAPDGRDIAVSGAGTFGLSDTQVSGRVQITGPLGEGGNLTITGAAPANAGLSAGVIDGVEVGEPVRIDLTETEGYDFNPDMTNIGGAQSTIGVMDRKLDRLLTLRARLGAIINVLEFKASNLASARDASAATASRIADADYAFEMVGFTKNQILQQAGLAISAQANAASRQVLALLLDTPNKNYSGANSR